VVVHGGARAAPRGVLQRRHRPVGRIRGHPRAPGAVRPGAAGGGRVLPRLGRHAPGPRPRPAGAGPAGPPAPAAGALGHLRAGPARLGPAGRAPAGTGAARGRAAGDAAPGRGGAAGARRARAALVAAGPGGRARPTPALEPAPAPEAARRGSNGPAIDPEPAHGLFMVSARQQKPQSRRAPQAMLVAWTRCATTSAAFCCLARRLPALQRLRRCKSSPGHQPGCGLRLASTAFAGQRTP
jgi:hypothetical protein